MFSKFLIVTGIEKDNGSNTVLKQIENFIHHKDFLDRYNNLPFTLILNKYQNIISSIDRIINPLLGKATIDDPFIAKEMEPVIRYLYESMAKK